MKTNKVNNAINEMLQTLAESVSEPQYESITRDIDKLDEEGRQIVVIILKNVVYGNVDENDLTAMANDMKEDFAGVETLDIPNSEMLEEGFKDTLKKIFASLRKGTKFLATMIGKGFLWLLKNPSAILSIASIIAAFVVLGKLNGIKTAAIALLKRMGENWDTLKPRQNTTPGVEMPHIGVPDWEEMVRPGGMEDFQRAALGI